MEKYFDVIIKRESVDEETFKLVLIDVKGQLDQGEIYFIENERFFKNGFYHENPENVTLACSYNSTGEFIEYVSIL